MSNGLSNINNKSLIRYLINNHYNTIFRKSIEALDQEKDLEYIFEPLDRVIEDIEEYLVVQVVTNNASAYRVTKNELMDKRKYKYWTLCATHCIALILEKFVDLTKHNNALSKEKKINNIIYNHSSILTLRRKFYKKELLWPATTRCTIIYSMKYVGSKIAITGYVHFNTMV